MFYISTFIYDKYTTFTYIDITKYSMYRGNKILFLLCTNLLWIQKIYTWISWFVFNNININFNVIIFEQHIWHYIFLDNYFPACYAFVKTYNIHHSNYINFYISLNLDIIIFEMGKFQNGKGRGTVYNLNIV